MGDAKVAAMELDRVLALTQALNDEHVEYIVIGGVAVNIHGIIRATEDVDLFIRPETNNIDRLRQALRRLWNDDEIDQIVMEDLAGEYAVVRYGPPDEDFVVDLMTRVGEVFTFDDLEWEVRTIRGVDVRVATPATLYRMKVDTVRPHDKHDALRLAENFDVGGNDR